MHATRLESFLPGHLVLGRGTPGDYAALERFHYRPGRPATWAGVWVVRYSEESGGMDKRTRLPVAFARDGDDHGQTSLPMPSEAGRLVAVAVLSYPTINSAARDAALGMTGWPAARKLARVNRDVRTISRVVVHPQFRGVGLASRLVAAVCEECSTRWVEAFAVMGRVHPFFEKGGMTRQAPTAADAPVYYIFDRSK
jgi:GNAT superfamily N-acetyltransferase